MPKPKCKTAGCRLEAFVLYDRDEGIRRKLVTRRDHFFSKDFNMEVVDDDPDIGSPALSPSPTHPLTRSQVNLVLMIVAVGIPVLLYSIG